MPMRYECERCGEYFQITEADIPQDLCSSCQDELFYEEQEEEYNYRIRMEEAYKNGDI